MPRCHSHGVNVPQWTATEQPWSLYKTEEYFGLIAFGPVALHVLVPRFRFHAFENCTSHFKVVQGLRWYQHSPTWRMDASFFFQSCASDFSGWRVFKFTTEKQEKKRECTTFVWGNHEPQQVLWLRGRMAHQQWEPRVWGPSGAASWGSGDFNHKRLRYCTSKKYLPPNSKYSSKKPGSVDFSGQFIHFRSLTGAVVGWETKPHMIPRCQERINWFCVFSWLHKIRCTFFWLYNIINNNYYILMIIIIWYVDYYCY